MQRRFHFFPGIGRPISGVGIGDAALDLGLPGSLDFSLARTVAFLQEFPDQPVEPAGRQLARFFEELGSGARHREIVARLETTCPSLRIRTWASGQTLLVQKGKVDPILSTPLDTLGQISKVRHRDVFSREVYAKTIRGPELECINQQKFVHIAQRFILT